MGMTMAEKVLARASGREKVQPGEFVTGKIDILMGHDLSFYAGYEAMIKSGYHRVWDSDKIVAIIDHAVPAPNVAYADVHRKIREYVKTQGIKNFYDAGVGICHQILPEKGHALPGRLIVGGDSHTTTYGALGAASCGIGISEVAYVMVKGSLWFRIPETIRFILKGMLPRGTSAKDIILKIAGQYTAEVAQYKAVEFAGPLAKSLSVDQRMTISNMGVEIGTKFAFFEADEKTVSYLKERTDQPVKPFGPDPEAKYLAVYEMDVSMMEPQVAFPHNVDNVKSISEIGEIPVQQAFIGSCTNARTEDLERTAAILKGRRVHPGTRLLVIPASHVILTELSKSGTIQTLLEAGAMIGTPGCGPCGGGHMGILAPGETAISSTNRNFKGRMGSPESFVYLASPETVAASAIEGKIADPRKYLKN
ncbi:MAG: 3-isopropylmalate dehydratase large subunit [Deltaproteobacteria bacterium]|nr:3-isopropylmalate dehydratase large subunit [Deltaproteobacteria bacterium]